MSDAPTPIPEVPDLASLLLVDDDPVLCEVLARALLRRGFTVTIAHSVDEALRAVEADPPEYAVIDLKLPDQSGLKLIARLKSADENTRVVMLTGHASIPTAIEAIKLGAVYYLPKPANADEVVAAFQRENADDNIAVNGSTQSVEHVEWEHISRVLRDHDGNISATARALSMHRRTLQRKLRKPPDENK
jgi:two-component system, response regulator RegA